MAALTRRRRIGPKARMVSLEPQALWTACKSAWPANIAKRKAATAMRRATKSFKLCPGPLHGCADYG